MRTILRMQETIWYVVEESSPVLISSINSVLHGPTTISPAQAAALFGKAAVLSCQSQGCLAPGQHSR